MTTSPTDYINSPRPRVIGIPTKSLELAVEHLLEAIGLAVNPVTHKYANVVDLGIAPGNKQDETARRLRKFAVEVVEEITGCQVILYDPREVRPQ